MFLLFILLLEYWTELFCLGTPLDHVYIHILDDIFFFFFFGGGGGGGGVVSCQVVLNHVPLYRKYEDYVYGNR